MREREILKFAKRMGVIRIEREKIENNIINNIISFICLQKEKNKYPMLFSSKISSSGFKPLQIIMSESMSFISLGGY